MHHIEPFYKWANLYSAAEDEKSPFFGREYSEFEYSTTIYNHYIHPQWDDIGSSTLFIKILYTDYSEGFSIIELFGEWNDCINNDIMFLKREIVDHLLLNGIKRFILIGENILNFHSSDDCYYEEWFEDIEEGWIVFINFREHVLKEFQLENIDYYILLGGNFNDTLWRCSTPNQLFDRIKSHLLEI